MFANPKAPTHELILSGGIMKDMLLKQDCKCYFCSALLNKVTGHLSRIIPLKDSYWDRFPDAQFSVAVYNHIGNLCMMCDDCYTKRVQNPELFEIKTLYRKYIKNYQLLTQETLVCPHCDKCYQSLKSMKAHVLAFHPESKIYNNHASMATDSAI